VGAEISKVSVAPDQPITSNEDVWLHLNPEKIRWMDAASGEAIR